MIWVAVLVALGAAPFVLERRKPDMTPELRDASDGQFAMLSDGHTHFRWHGPKEGPVLVCIHGLTTPSYVWDPLLPGLTAAGFRVLTYDLYGRGLSDRPNGTQTRSFFIRQLRDLLDHLGVEGRFSVLGYSMGGSIATIFAAEEPGRIERVLLLAPAGVAHTPPPLTTLMRRVPFLGDWLMLTTGALSARHQTLQSGVPEPYATWLAAEPRRRGYLPAVLSSLRNLLSETLEEEHRAIATAGLPIAVVWAEKDTVIPFSARGQLTEWNDAVRHASVPQRGHAFVMSHPDEALRALQRLL